MLPLSRASLDDPEHRDRNQNNRQNRAKVYPVCMHSSPFHNTQSARVVGAYELITSTPSQRLISSIRASTGGYQQSPGPAVAIPRLGHRSVDLMGKLPITRGTPFRLAKSHLSGSQETGPPL
jgi:hypothetical protein